jgi:S-adenosylmethionine synthetase
MIRLKEQSLFEVKAGDTYSIIQKKAMQIIISNTVNNKIEMAERKGIGHPDTICDEITEQISLELSRYYLNEFGSVMHYNVDKALLIGGQSQPAFLGGRIIHPISLIIAGRATFQVQDKIIPVEEIVVETAKKWLKKNIRHLDVSGGLQVLSRIRTGSPELVELFTRFGQGETPLANDTSFGAGYYPLSALETAIINIEGLLKQPDTIRQFPFIGEDTKVMGVRNDSKYQFTIAIAIVDQYISDIQDYAGKIQSVKKYILKELQLKDATIFINTADDYSKESIYLTVTGTSAESGDDGQVGRGNRINGLITPYRPMTLEATSGKNPVSHIGKVYNHYAMDLSRAIVDHQLAEQAEVFIVSQIGKPITEPQCLHLRLKNKMTDDQRIESFVKEKLPELSGFWKSIVGGPILK